MTRLAYWEQDRGLMRDVIARQMQDEGEIRCDICRRLLFETRLVHIDHCHKTGVIRGWLCPSCNRGLALFGERPDHLEAAASYLRRWQP